jgi:hypothetical protein
VLVRRPDLWSIAAIEGWRMVPRRWWRRWPPGPQPDAGYLHFRLQTFYGDPGHRPEAQDLVAWLEWCRRLRLIAR